MPKCQPVMSERGQSRNKRKLEACAGEHWAHECAKLASGRLPVRIKLLAVSYFRACMKNLIRIWHCLSKALSAFCKIVAGKRSWRRHKSSSSNDNFKYIILYKFTSYPFYPQSNFLIFSSFDKECTYGRPPAYFNLDWWRHFSLSSVDAPFKLTASWLGRASSPPRQPHAEVFLKEFHWKTL